MTRRAQGRLEAEVLAALAAADAFIGTVELCERLDSAPTRSTVNTILNRLRVKGMVRRIQVGRGYEYRLAVEEADVVAGRMHEHLRLASDQQHVLSRFIETLSVEQARLLHALLDDQAASASSPGGRARDDRNREGQGERRRGR
ncbi:BlaI/MecI/CopY family transcriptional regulator [Spirillospora sp. NPDC049652]